MSKYVIGIDPDVNASGLAVYSTESRQFHMLVTLSFWPLFATLEAYGMDNAFVIVEAGWLNKVSNYHREAGAARREKIARNVGANHEVGKKIVEWLEYNNYGHAIIRPDKKNDKWDADRFKHLTGLKHGYNSEIRDAVRVMWQYRNANLITQKTHVAHQHH